MQSLLSDLVTQVDKKSNEIVLTPPAPPLPPPLPPFCQPAKEIITASAPVTAVLGFSSPPPPPPMMPEFSGRFKLPFEYASSKIPNFSSTPTATVFA